MEVSVGLLLRGDQLPNVLGEEDALTKGVVGFDNVFNTVMTAGLWWVWSQAINSRLRSTIPCSRKVVGHELLTANLMAGAFWGMMMEKSVSIFAIEEPLWPGHLTLPEAARRCEGRSPGTTIREVMEEDETFDMDSTFRVFIGKDVREYGSVEGALVRAFRRLAERGVDKPRPIELFEVVWEQVTMGNFIRPSFPSEVVAIARDAAIGEGLLDPGRGAGSVKIANRRVKPDCEGIRALGPELDRMVGEWTEFATVQKTKMFREALVSGAMKQAPRQSGQGGGD